VAKPSFSRELTFEPAHYSLWWPVAGLLAVLAIVFYPYLFEGKIMLPTDMFDTMTAPFNAEYGPPQAQNHYFYDGIVQAYPYKIETQEALRKGHLAYWNTHILGGYPQYAETLANNFDPSNILLLWLPAITAMHVQIYLQIFIAGIGMLLLLRFLGVSRWVNLLFSAAYMLNGMFIATSGIRLTTGSFCWVPFLALMLALFLSSKEWRYLLYGMLFTALAYVGGSIQSSFYVACIITVILLWYPSTFSLLKRVSLVFLAIMSSMLLSAIMWMPTLQLFYQVLFGGGSLNSTNVYTGYSILHRFLSLPMLIVFPFPELLGSPQIFSPRIIAGLDVTNFNGSIGFIPALFAISGCIVFWRNKTLRPFIILILGAIFLPILTPLYKLLYHRVFIVASFAMCVTGAVYAETFFSDASLRLRTLKISSIALSTLLIMLTIVCAIVTFAHQSLVARLNALLAPKLLSSAFGVGNESWAFGRIEKTLHYYSFNSPYLWISMLLAVLSIGALWQYHRSKLGKRPMMAVISIATVAQIILFARMTLPSVNPVSFPVYPKNKIISFLQSDTSDSRYCVWRDAVRETTILPANSSDVYNIADYSGYESLTSPSLSVLYNKRTPADSLNLRLLGLASVRYILTGSRVIESPDAARRFSADGVTIYENLLSKPRAFFANHINIVASDSAVVSALLRNDFDGSSAVFQRDDSPDPTSVDSNSHDSVRIIHAGENELLLESHTASKALLVLTDSYYPGWKCSVNGQRRRIYRANGFMRAVVVDSGRSSIVFRFEPAVFTAGATTSLIAFLFWLSALAYLNLRSRKKNEGISRR